MRRFLLTLTLMVGLLLSGVVYAGATTQISGTVTDENGNPLELATIKILGTPITVRSDEDGYFSRTDIPPGTYDVVASAPGYIDFRYEQVLFITDVRRTLNFTMQRETGITTEIRVTVEATRRMIERDIVDTRRYLSAEQIDRLPADNFYDLMASQAGIVMDDGFMHVRGGRATEITYMLDDMSIINPVSGYAGTTISNIAIAEMTIISGAFTAEYGNAQSAIVNLTTKAGSTSAWEATLRGRMDVFQSTKELSSQKVLASTYEPDPESVPVTWTTRTREANFWKVEGAFGGPVTDFMTAFFAGEYWISGGELPRDEPRKEYNVSGKIRMSFAGDPANPANKNMSFTLSGNLSQFTRQLWNIQWQYNLDNYIYQARDTYQITGLWRHLVSERTWYTIRGNYYNMWTHAGARWNEGDITYAYVDGEVQKMWSVYGFEHTQEELRPYSEHTLGGWKWWEDYDMRRTQRGPDGWFFTSGNMRWYEVNKQEIITIKADIQSELDRHNLLKGGIEFRQYDVDYFQRQPLPLNIYGDFYQVRPWSGAAYIQDKMDYAEMVVSLGLRFDYFDPSVDYPDNPMDSRDNDREAPYETFDDIPRIQATPKYQLSPRIGISHPITEFDKIHFSYGHFFQMPVFRFLYMGNFERPSGAFPIFGNPDLKPEKTITYEAGIQHVFRIPGRGPEDLPRQILLDVTGFYKDISNQVDTVMINHPMGVYNYTRTVNADWGNVRGVEVVLEGSWTDWFSSKVSYTYSIARGISSDWRQGYDYSWSGWNLPLEANYLDWDVTHMINMMLDFRHGGFGFNINANIGSGTPYSPPVEAGGQPNINSERMPWQIHVDAKATYDIKLWGMNFGIFVEGFNLLDRWNVNNLGPGQGGGGATDWTYYYHEFGDENGPWDDMAVYGQALQLRVGASVSF